MRIVGASARHPFPLQQWVRAGGCGPERARPVPVAGFLRGGPLARRHLGGSARRTSPPRRGRLGRLSPPPACAIESEARDRAYAARIPEPPADDRHSTLNLRHREARGVRTTAEPALCTFCTPRQILKSTRALPE